MPAPIFDFASLSFHVPIKASSAAMERLAATAEMRSATTVIFIFMRAFSVRPNEFVKSYRRVNEWTAPHRRIFCVRSDL
jgi:hypothetical protein